MVPCSIGMNPLRRNWPFPQKHASVFEIHLLSYGEGVLPRTRCISGEKAHFFTTRSISKQQAYYEYEKEEPLHSDDGFIKVRQSQLATVETRHYFSYSCFFSTSATNVVRLIIMNWRLLHYMQYFLLRRLEKVFSPYIHCLRAQN